MMKCSMCVKSYTEVNCRYCTNCVYKLHIHENFIPNNIFILNPDPLGYDLYCSEDMKDMMNEILENFDTSEYYKVEKEEEKHKYLTYLLSHDVGEKAKTLLLERGYVVL